jgi:peptidoglycan hydrolase-like protein with peptidoglycan-binding domain
VRELGDSGRGGRGVQRALGISADGVFGPRTLEAIRSFQARVGLAVDGIVGPQTRAALLQADPAPRNGGGHTHESSGGQASAASMPDVDRRLAGAVGLAREMGLKVISGYREGATIAASGNRSDHSYYPSRAIDVRGTPAQMSQYARAVAGAKGVDTVIYAGVGIWTGGGWHAIQSSVTYRDHVDHVHVDTF